MRVSYIRTSLSIFFLATALFVIIKCCPVAKDPILINCNELQSPSHIQQKMYNYLNSIGYQKQCVCDTNGGVLYNDRLLVKFNDGLSEAEQDDLAAAKGAKIERCSCYPDNVTLWLFEDADAVDLEGTKVAIGGNSDIEEAEFVPIVFSTLDDNFYGLVDSVAPASINNINDTIFHEKGPIVAILDSGFDFDYPGQETWKNFSFVRLENECDADKRIGMNIINPGENPNDDHGHGSHITGIIIQQMNEVEDSPYRLMIVKTHDKEGVSSLFNIYCGLRYAQLNNANIINASFGWYNTSSEILETLVQELTTKDMLIVSSAGNLNTNTDLIPHYPSGFNIDNIISATALDENSFTIDTTQFNYGKTTIDYATPGVDISSFVPSDYGSVGVSIVKSGTSMAAAHLTALSIIQYNCNMPTADRVMDIRSSLDADPDIKLMPELIHKGALVTAKCD